MNLKGTVSSVKGLLLRGRAYLLQLHPLTKFVAEQYGWVTPTAFAFGAWGVSEYLAAMILFSIGGIVLALKVYHWQTLSAGKRVGGIVGCLAGILLICLLINIQRDTDPLSKTYAKWKAHHQPIAATSAPPALATVPQAPSAALPTPSAPKVSQPTLRAQKPKPLMPGKTARPSESTPKITPALSVGIMGPSDPELIVENLSDSLADRIVWELVMFRVSDQAFFSFATQDMGYLKPHSKSPGYSMHLENLPRAPGGDQLRDGDEFIGSLSVDCPICKGTTLIVSLVWHKGGWFYEVPNTNGGLILPKDMSKEAITQYVSWLPSIVPVVDRRPILTRPQ